MSLVELMQQIYIVVRCPEVKRIIHDALVGCVGKFIVECLQRSRLRIAVRHIHERGYSSRCGSRRFAQHISFVRQSRITKMYMIIYNSRNKVTSMSIDFDVAQNRGSRFSLQNFTDRIAFDHNRTGKL